MSQVDVSKIKRVYSGRPGCGCGCRGEYYTDKRNVTRVVNVINKALAEHGEVESHEMRVGMKGGIAFFEGPTRYYWAYTYNDR